MAREAKAPLRLEKSTERPSLPTKIELVSSMSRACDKG